MKTIYIENPSNSPKLVIVFPVTRESTDHVSNWLEVLAFCQNDSVSSLVVIDKTNSQSASQFFLKRFDFIDKKLFILYRDITETLFESTSAIELGENLWIMQLHDDDSWKGQVDFPEETNELAVYFFDFYKNEEGIGISEIEDFSLPNRIVFSLVPSRVWNAFALYARSQVGGVAGSFDYVLFFMAKSCCVFIKNSNFAYYWNNHQWKSKRQSINHLRSLTLRDGWGDWAVPEIAIVNRALDCLSSIPTLDGILSRDKMLKIGMETLSELELPIQKTIIYQLLYTYHKLWTRLLQFLSLGIGVEVESKKTILNKKPHQFLIKSQKVKNFRDILFLIESLMQNNSLISLKPRFKVWQEKINQIEKWRHDFHKENLKRVLMIFSNSYDGHYPRDLAKGFFQNGVNLVFISLSGAKVPDWMSSSNAKDSSKNMSSGFSLLRQLFHVLRVIGEVKPDIIQTHLFRGSIVGLVAGRLTKIPVVHTRHHIDEHYQSGSAIHRLLDRLLAKYSDHVIVCSNAARDWLVKVEKVAENHITVINQGFDFENLNPSQTQVLKAYDDIGFSRNNINVLCVSRYSKAKGQEYLLFAMKSLVKKYPNIKATFVGDGDSRWLSDLVIKHQMAEYVELKTFRRDIPACLVAADVIVHPSLADAFSQLVIEAQAVGGVLVTTDIAAAREQVIDGETGVIVPPRNPERIVVAVDSILSNPEFSDRLRRKGPIHVRRKFPYERMIEEELVCLASIIQVD